MRRCHSGHQFFDQERESALWVLVSLGVYGCKEVRDFVMESMPQIYASLPALEREGRAVPVLMRHLVHSHQALPRCLREQWVNSLVDCVLKASSTREHDRYYCDFYIHKLELLVSDVSFPARYQFSGMEKLDTLNTPAVCRFRRFYGHS